MRDNYVIIRDAMVAGRGAPNARLERFSTQALGEDQLYAGETLYKLVPVARKVTSLERMEEK